MTVTAHGRGPVSARVPRIIAFGAVTQDVHVTGPGLREQHDPLTGEAVQRLLLGNKLELDGLVFDVGGGASNAAVTFARQGLRSTFVGCVGDDPAGAAVLQVLQDERVATDLVTVHPTLPTAYSVILLADTGERTALVFRGASHELRTADLRTALSRPADWYYVSSLAGDLELLARLTRAAQDRGARLALNPGAAELARADELRDLLAGVGLLIANREELGALFGGATPVETLRAASAVCPVVALTDGPAGAYAAAGGELLRSGVHRDVPVVDRLGAGDAFSSAFTTAIARGGGLRAALTLGAANATSVVGRIGAKPGILRRGDAVGALRVDRVRSPAAV